MHFLLFLIASLCDTINPLLLAGYMMKDPTASLKKLMEGNRRYVEGASIHREEYKSRREELISAQEPFAIVVGCSDSRVPPEIVFDQGLGDLFVVRVAGNVTGPSETDSIEFSAEKLGAPLIFVLGHHQCGAVNAFMGESKVADFINIGPQIEKAIEETRGMAGDHWMNAVQANVRLSIKRLKENPVLKRRILAKQLEIHGGYYDLKTGEVHLLH